MKQWTPIITSSLIIDYSNKSRLLRIAGFSIDNISTLVFRYFDNTTDHRYEMNIEKISFAVLG